MSVLYKLHFCLYQLCFVLISTTKATSFRAGVTVSYAKYFTSSLFILVISLTVRAQDVLLQKNLTLKTDQIDAVLSKTEDNIKIFIDNFDVQLDSGAKITSPKVVSGTLLQPVLQVSIKKCVFFFCQNIDLDAEFTLHKVGGACDVNYELVGDLQRSSPLLADLYSHINTIICIKKTVGGATAGLTVTLDRSAAYQSGIVQKQTLSFIQLQANSLVVSFSRVMLQNGVAEVR